MSRVKPKPPTEAVLESEVAASLKALGLPENAVGESLEDRAVAALERLIRKHKRLVATREVAVDLGVSPNTALSALDRAAKNGRVHKKTNSQTSRSCFVPKVT